jgi:hypothetical protein
MRSRTTAAIAMYRGVAGAWFLAAEGISAE